MTAKREKAWHLNPAEVCKGQVGYSFGGRRKRRQSRALDLRNLTVNLVHLPTGIIVEDTIPLGHYSRKEMQRLRDNLYKELFDKLEKQVARKLSIPGF